MARLLYRWLLRLCPPDLRAEFGAEMEALFLSALARARGPGKLRVWLRAVSDVVRHGLGARNDGWNRLRVTSAYVEYDTRGFWMDTWRYDLRHALRMMSRQPGTAAIIVLTLALAIGANTAVFSTVHAVLLKPLPYAQPDALMMVYEKRPAEGVFNNSVSPADYVDWAAMNTSFSAIAAFSESSADLTGAGDPERLTTAGVTAAFFDVFGVRALHGRTFEAGDDVLGRHRVVVLEHALWRQRFGGDPGVVGRTITFNDIPHVVVGVLPPAVQFPAGEVRVFAPMVLQSTPEAPLPRASHFLRVYARLKPGVSIDQAQSDMDRIGRDLEQQHVNMSRGHGSHATPLAPEMVKDVRKSLLIMQAAVGFILLIACINVTNLLLARAAGRRREIAVRSAIGANRARLVRQMLVEAGCFAFAGGAIGIVLSLWGVRLLAAQMPPAIQPDSTVVFSVPVLLFTMAVCSLSGLLAGVLPALQLVREDPSETLKEGGRSPVSLRRRLRFGLIVSEVAFTALLLVGAGLTLRSFRQVLLEPAGVETANRLTFNISLPRSRYPDAAAGQRFYAELEQRLAAEPSIRKAGATNALPLGPIDGRRGIVIEGDDRGPDDGPTRAHPRGVTANYTAAAGMRVIEGRGLLPSDRATSPQVALVNQALARRYFRTGSPIGRRVRFTDQENWREVVGIVADVKHWGLDVPVNPELYLPAEQYPSGLMTFVLEAASDPLTLVPNVRNHVSELDPKLPLSQVRTFDAVAARSVEYRRFVMLLLGCFAVLALVLAAAGIYGVMSHLVSLRTPEIGVRLTLGAKPSSVLRQVLGEGALQALVGLAIGLGASLVLMKGLTAILFGIQPTDPVTLVAVGVALMVMALLAVAVPAYRAMRVDPVTALRAG